MGSEGCAPQKLGTKSNRPQFSPGFLASPAEHRLASFRAKARIRARDRVVLVLAARVFGSVLKAITIVRPETVGRWHRSFWRLIWRKKSGGSVLDSSGSGARKRGRLEPRRRPNLDGMATREDEPATPDL
jgi:hypothetical protein